MPQYRLITVSPIGERIQSTHRTAGAGPLLRECEERGLVVVSLEEAREPQGANSPAFGRPTRTLEIIRSLSALLGIGLSLPEAIAEATALVDADAHAVLDSIATEVAAGEPLADAMAQHPAWFNGFVVGVVRSGERSGSLAAALDRLERKLERDTQIRAELVNALVYPALLTLVGGAAVCVLLAVVLPRFAEILVQSGGTLPATTRVLLSISSVASSWWGVVALGAGAAAAVAPFVLPQSMRVRLTAYVLLHSPGIATARRDLLTARYSRMLSVLLGGGAPLSEALRHCAEAQTDPIAGHDASVVDARVREGASFQAALRDTVAFSRSFVRLVAAGEATGRLADFLERAADYFERRLERATRRGVALVEPALILAFGLAVGFVALAVVQSIYSLNANLW